MNVEFAVFARNVHRCREITEEPSAPQVLVAVYQTLCAQPFTAYLGAMAAVDTATTRVTAATTGLDSLLDEVDQLFRVARCTVAAVMPATTLPLTLKSQPTDTDKREAIVSLLALVTPHAGQAWADALLGGEFGQTTPAAIQQLNECILARNALQRAKADRAEAFEPAWDAYVRFKRLVRNTYGSAARQYRRIHVPKGVPADEAAEAPEAEAPEAKAPKAKALKAGAAEPRTAQAEAAPVADAESAPPVSEPVPSAA